MSDLTGGNSVRAHALATLGALAPVFFALGTTSCGDDGSGDRSPVVYARLDMIDDMEDGDLSIREVNGRSGSWQAFNDGTLTGTEDSAMTNMVPPRTIAGSSTGSSMSQHGYHISGGGYSGWGAGWMVDFNTASGRAPYDASDYAGIVFWAKSDGPPTEVKVALPDIFSDTAGGLCDPNDNRVGGKGCYDDFATNITLTRQWRRYEIAFSSIATGNWGLRHAFDTQHVYGIKFSVTPSYALFDSWIDDVSFYYP
jgi:hypothetical protein